MKNSFTTDSIDPADTLAPRVSWGRSRRDWSLVQVWEGRQNLFPPGRVKTVPRSSVVPTEIGGTEPRPLVVIGEHGSGLGSFTRWLMDVVVHHEPEGRLVRLDLSREAGESPDRSRLESSLLEQLQKQLPEKFHSPQTPTADIVDILREYESGAHAPLTVVFYGFEGAIPEHSMTLWARLRGLGDRGRLTRIKLVITARREEVFTAGPFSDFMSVCEVSRTPSFLHSEIEGLWCRYGPAAHRTTASEVAETVLRWTGGQALLVQCALKNLFDEPDRLGDLGRWFLDHPPPAVRRWQERLAALAHDRTALRRRMQEYVEGGRDGGDTTILPLFLAGWVSADANGRFGIRSESHQAWARDPLRFPNRFLDGER